jgi:Tfp pilus assembly protein PilV
MTARSNRPARRGSLLAEVTMAAVLLMIAMTLTVKVMGYAGIERRATERRQRALLEVANLMERITAYQFDEVTSGRAGRMTISDEARRSLPDPELVVDVAEKPPGVGRRAKRIAISLRWRGRSGEWERPVRLTSWIERREEAS